MKRFLLILLSASLLLPACGKKENPLRMTPVVKISKEKSPGVVNISTEQLVLVKTPQQKQGGPDFSFPAEQMVSGYQAVKLPSLGSGVVIDKTGLILTNAHVVQRATTIFVILSDGTKLTGKVVGLNQTYDLAVIKIEPPSELKVLDMADPDDLYIGEPVIALGNPFGLSSSVSTGVVSAVHRDLFTPQGQLIFKDLIQTDTAINPGSSGGALLNMDGKLIGINQIVAQQAQGIGFAIPVKTVKPLLEEFKTNYAKLLEQQKNQANASLS